MKKISWPSFSHHLDLLKQARNMEEILTVQHEINDIQEEIETVSGRIGYLNHSAAMSTIHFTFYQVLDPAAIASAETGFGEKITMAFSNGWMWIKEIAIALISIWPLLLAATVILILLRKKGLLKLKPGKLN